MGEAWVWAGRSVADTGASTSNDSQLIVAERPARPANHVQQWANLVAETFGAFSIQARQETKFQVTVQNRSGGGFGIARFTTIAGRAQLERTQGSIRCDGRDDYVLYLSVSGEHELVQYHRQTICSPECMALISTGEPFVQTKFGDNDTLYLSMPRAFVEERLIRCENVCVRGVGTRNGVARLAADTVAALQREAALISNAEFLGAARAAADLVLLGIAGVADLKSEDRSIRASNLARAKRVIRARLMDADLSLSDIATDCGISLRYLHDLFRDDGRTVREYLQEQRLQAARRLLERSPLGPATVTDVCMACGFATPSQFSTAFKRAFGLSPRDALRRG